MENFKDAVSLCPHCLSMTHTILTALNTKGQCGKCGHIKETTKETTMKEKKSLRKALYTGPNRSGLCVCGHAWDRHHLCMRMREYETEDGTKEAYVPCECEAYGANENSGLDRKGNYHCFGYVDAKEKTNESEENKDNENDKTK